MQKARLGVLGLSVAALVLTLLAINVSAGPAPACNTIKIEAECKAREDCSWVGALIDSNTGKQKRKAYCRKKSVPKKKS